MRVLFWATRLKVSKSFIFRLFDASLLRFTVPLWSSSSETYPKQTAGRKVQPGKNHLSWTQASFSLCRGRWEILNGHHRLGYGVFPWERPAPGSGDARWQTHRRRGSNPARGNRKSPEPPFRRSRPLAGAHCGARASSAGVSGALQRAARRAKGSSAAIGGQGGAHLIQWR